MIQNQRNKNGWRFAFVRFPGCENMEKLESCLDTMWIESFKLWANIPKYARSDHVKTTTIRKTMWQVLRVRGWVIQNEGQRWLTRIYLLLISSRKTSHLATNQEGFISSTQTKCYMSIEDKFGLLFDCFFELMLCS